MKRTVKEALIRYAEQYECREFINGDPSWFMHQVSGRDNQEAMAFIASCLSYGRRPQFMLKISQILDWSGGDVDGWVRHGGFAHDLPAGDCGCFYRLFTVGQMHDFLQAYRHLMQHYGTLGNYVRRHATDGPAAVEAICGYFGDCGISVIVPKDVRSACKRVCMFLRWMVRRDSPVDLGLWADFIDRRTLIIPLDAHVMNQAHELGLLGSKTASMATARRLTASLARVFPDDPLRGDFTLFGHGINSR